ncbi:ubiquitin-like-specific protease 1 [Humulus lupulus]|uniref:ubiquitin-like-specific protease 1 n=1 Tax=Humulus lupulus TaxID=3486 RepID=UPI002B401A88|nr:ubiquitin-like-specific protease 1 [Humulus lupulus]XP_062082560.1 ubiquitin-like-specific protease 1 [Humulus lupulus]XP_062082561.1 ubiquitin-like-specific protease 1 [Humulus lupulus]XP_062082562.1 ubiquitin-like-specific protease 1 [Humulus lupulus]XP_062082563.1 ubiquitin-like-specific protease 1 [Humulus lupulus]
MSKSSSKDMSKPPMTSPHLSSAGSHVNPENTLTEGQPFADHIMNRIHVSLQFMVREFCRVKGINSVASIPVDPTFMNRESIFLTSEDVEQVSTLHMIGGSAMIFGLRCIWESLFPNQRVYYKFYDIERLSINNVNDVERSTIDLANWLMTMDRVGQLYFIPWNIREHWMLVIAMPKGKIVFLDPLKSHKHPEEIDSMIMSAYYRASSNALLGNPTKIFNVTCPRQPQSHECGFYVLKYIRDLVRASNAMTTLKEKFGGKTQYCEIADLLPIQHEWLGKLMTYIYQ